MTAMADALRAAHFPAAYGLPDHLKLVDGVYMTRGRWPREVPDQEIAWIGDRYVHACPIPTGYLEQLAKVAELHHRTLTSHVRFVAEERAEEEGYTSPAEFAQGMMREHLQETAHISAAVRDTAEVGDRLVRYGHLPAPIDKEPPAFLKQQPAKREPRVFAPSEMSEDPRELVDQQAFDRDIVAQMRALISLSDWDPALAYAQLKEWDALCSMYERLKFNVVQEGTRTAQAIARLQREAETTDEVPELELRRLERRLQGLRVQSYNFSRKFAMARIERERAVVQSGMDFGPYRTLADRAKLGAQFYEQQRTKRLTSDRLIGMSDAEYRKRLADGEFAYKPRYDGVDARDGVNNPATMGSADNE